MRRRTLLATGATTVMLAGLQRPARTQDGLVDVLLVLAVDVSRSIDDDEARLQHEGYRTAVSDSKIVEALRSGMLGSIGLAYVEWAGSDYQRLVLPWTRIASQADADAWAERLAAAPRVALSWTSVSGGIEFSRQVLAEAPFEGTRRVIDVSGDGVNNSGPPAEQARDRAVAEGITINGLPILNDRPTFGRASPVPLDDYYRDSVIGGPGAFVIAADDFESFGLAVRRKLTREVAALPGLAAGLMAAAPTTTPSLGTTRAAVPLSADSMDSPPPTDSIASLRPARAKGSGLGPQCAQIGSRIWLSQEPPRWLHLGQAGG
jgi:hypothetical protein